MSGGAPTAVELALRVGAVEAAQDAHEDVCAVRYAGIEQGMKGLGREIGEVKATIKEWRGLTSKLVLVGVMQLLAIIAFLALKVWPAGG